MPMHERYEVHYELLKKKGWKLPGYIKWDCDLKTGLTLRLQWLDGYCHWRGWKIVALGFRGVEFRVRRGSSGLRSGLDPLMLDPKLWLGLALMFGL